MPTIMAGLTQCIMLSLSMVVIAALVGAGGLGRPVVRALNTVNIAQGFEAGLAIVLVAILLDRVCKQRGAQGGRLSRGRGRVPQRRHRLRPATPDRALELLDQGETRETILEQTGHVIGRRRCHGRDRARRDLRADGPVGLGQVDAAALRQPAQQGDPRRGPGRRRRRAGRRRELRSGDAAPPAHPSHRHGVPAVRAAALAHGRRRTSASAWSCAAWPSPSATSVVEEKLEARQPRPVARQVRARALGRHAAAGRPRARVRDRCRHPADGRAVLGARSPDPRRACRTSCSSCSARCRRPSSSSATTSTRR